MRRNHTNGSVRKIIAFLLAIGIISIGTGCGANASTAESKTADESRSAISGSATSEAVPTASPAPTEASYADDVVVNQFITDYNATAESPISDISKGSIKTEYNAYSFGYYLDLIDSNDTGKITVTINETDDNASSGTIGMKDVFHAVAKVVDPSLTDDAINNYFDSLMDTNKMVENDTLGNIKVTFVPDAELSGGHSRGHIALAAQ